MATCPSVSTRWSLAEISVPITTIVVMTAMITRARATTATRESRSSVRPSRSNV